MKKIILFVVVFLFLCIQTFAVVKRICKAKYESNNGESNEYTMEVTFITGYELNKATKTYDYDSYDKYCLLWFSNGGVAILKITEFIYVSNYEFTDNDFRNVFSYRSSIECEQINGSGNENIKWTITAKNFSGFIDPREN